MMNIESRCREMKIEDTIATVPDWPKKGVQFQDITPLLANGEAYEEAIAKMAEMAEEMGADVIVGPESRGFMFACPVAYAIKKGFVPVRKKCKLPGETISYTYDLEYGTDVLYMRKDAIKKGQKVVVIDDIVAVGGTLNAAAKLIEQLDGEVAGMIALIGLTALPGVERLKKYNLHCLIYKDVKDEE